MINIIIDILTGLGLGLLINSDWFKNLINIFISRLFQSNTKKPKENSSDDLESFYKQIYKENKMQFYSAINYLLIYSIIIFLIVGITIMLLNAYISPARFGNYIIPNWALFLAGNLIATLYKQIEAKLKKSIKVTFADSLK
jgi:uncharacterized membrane protein